MFDLTNLLNQAAQEIGVQAAPAQTLEHTVTIQMYSVPQQLQNTLPVPIIRGTGDNKRIAMYSMFLARMHNPMANSVAGRYSDVWVMFNNNDGWNPLFDDLGNPIMDRTNAVKDTNAAMHKLLTGERDVNGNIVVNSPFSGFMLKGHMSEHWVPRDRKTNVRDVVTAGIAVAKILATNTVDMTEAELDELKAAQLAVYNEYIRVLKVAAEEGRVVKSGILLASQNGIMPNVSLTQNMDVKGSAMLSAAKLFANAQRRMTFVPQVNTFTGVATIIDREADENNPEYVFGLRKTEAKGRLVTTKSATIGHASRESEIHLSMYSNDVENSRSETFDIVTQSNKSIVILDGIVRLHPKYPSEAAISAVTFNVEVQNYIVNQQHSGIASFDASILSVGEALIDSDVEADEMTDAPKPDVTAVRARRGKRVVAETPVVANSDADADVTNIFG